MNNKIDDDDSIEDPEDDEFDINKNDDRYVF